MISENKEYTDSPNMKSPKLHMRHTLTNGHYLFIVVSWRTSTLLDIDIIQQYSFELLHSRLYSEEPVKSHVCNGLRLLP